MGAAQPPEETIVSPDESTELHRLSHLVRITMELGTDAIKLADVVLAPAIAVDTRGVRLGQGGGWYDRAIIIDGLGGTGDPYTDEGITRMSDRGWAETLATGVTAIRDTVLPVGNVADAWAEYQKGVAEKKNIFNGIVSLPVLLITKDGKR